MAFQIGEVLGTINYGGIESTLYWRGDNAITIELLDLGNDVYLLRGAKFYYISQTYEPDMQSRLESVGSLSEYLKAEWTSFELSMLYINTLSSALAEIDKKGLKKNIEEKRSQIRYDEQRVPVLRRDVSSHLRSQDDVSSLERKISDAYKEVHKLEEELNVLEQVEREYKKKGSAASFIIKQQSVIRESSSSEILAKVQLIVKELMGDRDVIKQQARKGLQIGLEELNVPHIAWLSESLGILDPRLLEAFATKYPKLATLKTDLEKLFTLKWAREAEVGGHASSSAHAQAIANLLLKASGSKEKYYIKSPDWKRLPQYNEKRRQGFLGFVADGNMEVTNYPFYLDYDDETHYAFLGMTRSGKTVGASVLAEGVLGQGITVVVIDPTGSWTAFLEKCNEKDLRDFYPDFNMKEPADFKGKIYTPASDVGLPMSTNLFAPPDTKDERIMEITAIEVSGIVEKLCSLGAREKTKLVDMLVKEWKKGGYLDYEEVIDQADGALAQKLSQLRGYHFLFEGDPIENIADLWKEKEVTVVSLKHLAGSQRIWAAYYLLRKIVEYFERRKETSKEAKLIVVIEEVYQFQIPENMEAYNVIEKAVRELLKRGVRLVLVTQKLTDLSTDIRQNVGSKFYFQQTDPSEKETVAEDIGSEFKDVMDKLPKGMVAVRIPDHDPFLVQFRPPFHRMKGLSDSEIAEHMVKWKEHPIALEKAQTEKGELTEDEAVFLEAVKNYYSTYHQGPYFAQIWKHQLKWTGASKAMRVKQSLIDKGLLKEEDDGKFTRLIPLK